ncbi:hypothetical protein [Rugosimonospora acidiphila]
MDRPILLPGLRRLWRGQHSLQLGTDPRRAVVFDFVDPATARVLDLIDGSRGDTQIVREAAGFGVPTEAAEAFLAALTRAGLVVGARTLLPDNLIEPVRRRLVTEVAALAMAGSAAGTPAEAVRRRAGARVRISGHGRLAAPIAAALAAAGVGHVDPALSGRVDVTDAGVGGILPTDTGRWRSTAAGEAVARIAPATDLRPLRDDAVTFAVHAGTHRPAELTALAYARRRIPHLALDLRDGLAVVGPLVPPAGSPCLNCVDLHRRDRDPVWPALAAQLSTGGEILQPCAVTTVLVAVGYAADEVLTFLDGGVPQTIGVTIEIAGPGRERRRTWPAHPRCGCARAAQPGSERVRSANPRPRRFRPA